MSIPCKMRPVGLESLPLGYTRLEYLEASSGSMINTKLYPAGDVQITAKSGKIDDNAASFVCGANTYYGNGEYSGIIILNRLTKSENQRVTFGGAKREGLVFNDSLPHLWEIKNKTAYIDGQLFATFEDARDEQSKAPIGLCCQLNNHYDATPGVQTYDGGQNSRIWSFKAQSLGQAVDMIPCLDETGAPCMLDLVSRTPFYNEGTGAFIAGFDTAEQARKLAYLPDVTAETDATKKSLTVSIPLDIALDPGVQSALDVAAARGWTIIVQHRESEIATTNLEADFLESTGTQYIDTSYYPCWDTEIKMTGLGMSLTSIFGCVSEKTQGYGWKNCYMLVMYEYGDPWAVFGKSIPGNGSYGPNVVKLSSKFEYRGDKNEITINDVASNLNYPSEPDTYRSPNTLFVAARNHNGVVELLGKTRIFDFQLSENGAPKINFIPALDPSGTPCMYDTVTGQNFYNQGTGQFTIGFDTTEKAAISLSKLPITTGGTLTVSLPSAAQNASTLVPAAIDIAESRGWTIIVQYRTN